MNEFLSTTLQFDERNEFHFTGKPKEITKIGSPNHWSIGQKFFISSVKLLFRFPIERSNVRSIFKMNDKTGGPFFKSSEKRHIREMSILHFLGVSESNFRNIPKIGSFGKKFGKTPISDTQFVFQESE